MNLPVLLWIVCSVWEVNMDLPDLPQLVKIDSSSDEEISRSPGASRGDFSMLDESLVFIDFDPEKE